MADFKTLDAYRKPNLQNTVKTYPICKPCVEEKKKIPALKKKTKNATA